MDNSNKITNSFFRRCFRAWSYNEDLLSNCSSGALFGEAASKVLSEGGVVFGAAFDDDWTVSIHEVNMVEDLHTLLGSKYVQAKTHNVYKRVEQLLSDGKKVLFCSTPCQCNGLVSFLNNGKDFDRNNLLIIDFICHGVPGEGVYRKYIDYISGEKKIIDVSFRDKRISWNHFGMRVMFDDNTEYFKEHHDDAYMKLFLANRILRPSCYRCKAKAHHRASDITLGDFWGIQGEKTEKGCSVAVINTGNGEKAFDSIKEKLNYSEIPFEAALRNNDNYFQSCGIPFNRNKVFERINAEPEAVFEKTEQYIYSSLPEKVIRRSIRIIRKMKKNSAKNCYLDTNHNCKNGFKLKAECCGCGICKAVCPVNAISMKLDNEGFYYPIIDEAMCIHCKKCTKACISIQGNT